MNKRLHSSQRLKRSKLPSITLDQPLSLSVKTSPKSPTSTGKTPDPKITQFHHTGETADPDEVIKALTLAPFNVHLKSELTGILPFHIICKRGDTSILSYAIKCG